MSKFDVTINAAGFMVDAGTYQRMHEGISNSRIGRVRVFDFFGGGQRAVQLERDRFWKGQGAWPAFDSQGIVPGPERTNQVESTGSGVEFNPQARTWYSIWDGVCYIAQEDRIYRLKVASGGGSAGLEHEQTLNQPITDCVATRGYWYFAHGDAAVVSSWSFNDGTYDSEALGSALSRKTEYIGTHLGRLVFQSVDDWHPDMVSMQEIDGTGLRQQRYVQAPVRAFVEHRGDCWFITERGLYRFVMTGVHDDDYTADYHSEATLPQIGYDDDLVWVVSHMGSLWLWMGREVHRYDATDRAFEPMGLRGRATYGAVSVGRYLVVNIDSEIDGLRQLWAWDGRGWWLVDEEDPADSSTRAGWPVAVWGTVANADLYAGRGDTLDRTARWQFFERDGAPGYRESMTLTSPLLDGGERDLDRVWREVGVIFAWPDDRTGTGAVDITLSASYDAGSTWTVLATSAISPSERVKEITADAAGELSRFIQIRVEVSSVTDWAPVLMGAWAEHETLDLPTRRRRWQFSVTAADTGVDRDGGRMRPARDQADDLWIAWELPVVDFLDIDGEAYSVRVASIRESIGRPGDAGGIATSKFEIGLVEV